MTDVSWIFMTVLSYVAALAYVGTIIHWYHRGAWRTRAVKKLTITEKVFLIAYGCLAVLGIVLGTVSLVCFFIF